MQLDRNEIARAIGPWIDPGATAPASDGLHSGCTGDEAPRPARSCRQREANPTRQSPSGRRQAAGRV